MTPGGCLLSVRADRIPTALGCRHGSGSARWHGLVRLDADQRSITRVHHDELQAGGLLRAALVPVCTFKITGEHLARTCGASVDGSTDGELSTMDITYATPAAAPAGSDTWQTHSFSSVIYRIREYVMSLRQRDDQLQAPAIHRCPLRVPG